MTGFDDLIERFDHLAMAVWDIPACLPMVQLIGGTFRDGADNQRNQFRWMQFNLPGKSKLEIIQPLPGNVWLTRHLEKRGEGVHHVTFKVLDLDLAVQRALSMEMETTGYNRTALWSEVFVHPKSAHGVVIQFAEWDDSMQLATSYEDVIAGLVADGS